MNKNEFKGSWKQLKGKAKQIWGKLTDDEIDQIEGNYDEFCGLLQKKYGYTERQTESKIREQLENINRSLK